MSDLETTDGYPGEPVAPVKLKHCPRLGYKVAPARCEEERALYARACGKHCPSMKEKEEMPAMKKENMKFDYRSIPVNAPPLGPGMVVTRTGRVRRGHGYWRLCPGCQKVWIVEQSKLCRACAGAQRRGKYCGGRKPGAPHKHYPKAAALPSRPHFNNSCERAGATVAALAGTSTFPRTQPDLITNPPYYCAGAFDCLDVIRALGFDFEEGSALKYFFRHKRKGTPLDDLKKSRFYIDALIKRYEAQP